MKRNLLVTLADNNYIIQAKQLFSSVYWNAGWDGDYMLLAHEIPDNELEWFINKGILVKKCEPLYKADSGLYDYPPVIFSKFYLFTPEFKKWKNILYLDSDIIVKAPLDQLTEITHFGAVRNGYFDKLINQYFKAPNQHSYDEKYNFNDAAFNSGVISFNTDLITHSTFGELLYLIKEHVSEFVFPDQAILNLYFYKSWTKLPLVYNVFINMHNYKVPAQVKAIIIHFFARIEYPPLWDPKNSYYLEWKTNLEKAELIELNKVQKAAKIDESKFKYNSLILKIDAYLRRLFKKIKNLLYHIINAPDRFVGKIGILIKKFDSDLYYKLKKSKLKKINLRKKNNKK